MNGTESTSLQPLRVLTLEHPWPLAIFFLGKSIENRSWKPSPKHIGTQILIHGGAPQILKNGLTSNGQKGLAFQGAARHLNTLIQQGKVDGRPLAKHWRSNPDVVASLEKDGSVPWSAWTLPGLVGVVTLLDVREDVKDTWAMEEQKHWILGEKILFREPIPIPEDDDTFRLGLWKLPAALLPQVHEAIRTGTPCP